MTSEISVDDLKDAVEQVVAELKQEGWKAEKGVIRGLPYVRVYITGAQIRMSFDSNQFAPKSWFWYIAESSYDWSWAGDFHGPIRSMAKSFDAEKLLLATQAVMFDPCAISKVYTLENFVPIALDPDETLVCPVCEPDSPAKQYPEGGFSPEFSQFERGNNLFENEEYQSFLNSIL